MENTQQIPDRSRVSSFNFPISKSHPSKTMVLRVVAAYSQLSNGHSDAIFDQLPATGTLMSY
jgi:hypothetical protein